MCFLDNPMEDQSGEKWTEGIFVVFVLNQKFLLQVQWLFLHFTKQTQII